MWNTLKPETSYTKEYNSMNETEKVAYFWDWIIRWKAFIWRWNILLSDLRKIEPNIELLFPLIEKQIKNFSPELWINDYIDFDDTPDQTDKIDKIEWIDFNNSELAEKIGDLFYNSLSDFLGHLSEKINKDLESNTELLEASKLIKKASSNIQEAWDICEPYIRTDFPEMKHTEQIKWTNISNEALAKWVWNLYLKQLWDLLLKLSKKLNIDWEADKWRWRTKLANELFESSKNIEWASNIIISLSNRQSSYKWEEVKKEKEWFLSRVWKLLW